MADDDDPNIHWEGTEEERTRWIEHKRHVAMRFVELGYSVEWSPDGENSMAVYLAERCGARQPEIRASVKFFLEPSRYGIDQGRISKLMIQRRRTDLLAKVRGQPWEDVELLFNYDRGADVDELASDPEARTLYEVILRELNEP